jgi:hypothetical protein
MTTIYDDELIEPLAKHYCESPIERQLLVAYLNAAVESEIANIHVGHNDEKFKGNDLVMAEYRAVPPRQPKLLIHRAKTDFVWIQLPIHNFRADLAFARVSEEVATVNGEPSWVLVKTPILIVECDGHDFHERTKEQARRDRSRDRYMTSLGFRVLRFTGSEIHRDAEACAQEISDQLDSLTSSLARS